MQADWYEKNGLILISFSQILNEDITSELPDCDIYDLENITMIASPLKRFNSVDGFYHA
jgi:hypothetical protein